MKNIRLYLLAVSALVVSVGSFLLSGVGASTASASDKDVIVVNTTSNPVPVVPQGSTAVTGTVSVSNLPEAVAIVPAGTPITLRQTLGLAGPIHASEHVVLYDSRSGSTHLNGQIAIGSISIALSAPQVQERFTTNFLPIIVPVMASEQFAALSLRQGRLLISTFRFLKSYRTSEHRVRSVSSSKSSMEIMRSLLTLRPSAVFGKSRVPFDRTLNVSGT